jgi:hypothetical protein
VFPKNYSNHCGSPGATFSKAPSGFSEIFMIEGEQSNERINTLTNWGICEAPRQLSDFHFCQMAVADLAARQEKIGTTTLINCSICLLKQSA